MKLMDSHDKAMIDSHFNNRTTIPLGRHYSTSVTVHGSRAWSLEGQQQLRMAYVAAHNYAGNTALRGFVWWDGDTWQWAPKAEVKQ